MPVTLKALVGHPDPLLLRRSKQQICRSGMHSRASASVPLRGGGRTIGPSRPSGDGIRQQHRLLHGQRFRDGSPCSGSGRNHEPLRLYGQPFSEWDLSVIKGWKLTERLTTQFRPEIYNVINSAHFGAPNTSPNSPTNLGEALATPDVGSASPVIGTGGPRKIQLGLKFRWCPNLRKMLRFGTLLKTF